MIYNRQDRKSVAVLQELEPNVFEVMVLYPFGSETAAVQAAANKVLEMLAGPNLGEAHATTPGEKDNSDRVATAALVQLVKADLLVRMQAMVAEAIAGVLQTPGVLTGMLPDTLPDTAETPWLNDGIFTVSPKD